MGEKLKLEIGESICRKPDCFVRPHVENGEKVEGWSCPSGCVVVKVVEGPNGGISIVVRRLERCRKTKE